MEESLWEVSGWSGDHEREGMRSMAHDHEHVAVVTPFQGRAGVAPDVTGSHRNASWRRSQLIDIDRPPGAPRSWWRRLRWWLTPLAVIALVVAAFYWALEHIEDDIEQSAPSILSRSLPEGTEIGGLTYEADYRDLLVGGVLPPGVPAAEIERVLEDDAGIRDADVTAVAGERGAVDVTVAANREEIVLLGTVPTQTHKALLLRAAVGRGLSVVDELVVSDLEPSSADADAQISKLTKLMGELSPPNIATADLTLGDEGEVTGNILAADAIAAASLRSASGSGVTVIAPALESLDVDVAYDGAGIVLRGTVFSEGDRDQLEETAASVVGDDGVASGLRISELDSVVDDPSSRIAALATTMATFAGLESAELALTDEDLILNAVAIDASRYEATMIAVDSAEQVGLRVSGEVGIAEPQYTLAEEVALLQAELVALQDEIRENVRFESDAADLSPNAAGTLNKVIDAMQRYQRPVVEVGGHTDSQGADDYNLQLSQGRADAVGDYLIWAGVDAARIRGVGYGETDPIEGNALEDGRSTNRRVEFVAMETFE